MQPIFNERLREFLCWLVAFGMAVVGTAASAKIVVSPDMPALWLVIAGVCLPLNGLSAAWTGPKAYRAAKEYIAPPQE